MTKVERTREERKERVKNVIGGIVLASFLVPIIWLAVMICNSKTDMLNDSHRSRGDYVLMLVQCLLGVFALIIPNAFFKKKGIQIPTGMYILYMIFLYCAIYLGEVKSFYYNVPHWDTILHTFSGGMIGALGFSFVSIFNKAEKLHINLSPFFVSLFAFMFSVTLGVVWEIYEFSFDGILGLNMQKFMLESGENLVGRAALMDTMKDLIVDMVGAFIMSLIGYISLKYKKGWIENLYITVKKEKK